MLLFLVLVALVALVSDSLQQQRPLDCTLSPHADGLSGAAVSAPGFDDSRWRRVTLPATVIAALLQNTSVSPGLCSPFCRPQCDYPPTWSWPQAGTGHPSFGPVCLCLGSLAPG